MTSNQPPNNTDTDTSENSNSDSSVVERVKAKLGLEDTASTYLNTSGTLEHDVSEQHKDFIAPQMAVYHRDEVELESGYARTYYINGWPEAVLESTGYLESLFKEAQLSFDTSIHAHPLEHEESKSLLSEIWANLRRQADDDAKAERLEARDSQRNVQKAEVMQDLLSQGHRLFRVSCYFTIRADTKEQLEQVGTNVVSTLEREADSDPRNASLVQDKALRTSSPLAQDELDKSTYMFGDALGEMFPFATSSILEQTGINMGLNQYDNTPVIVDPYNRNNGYNRIVIGKIGSGKSFSVGQDLLRYFLSRNDTELTIIDPMGGFLGVTQALGGDRIVVDGNEALNPLELEKTPEHVLEAADGLDPFNNKLEDVNWFINGFFSIRNDGKGAKLSKEERGVLDRAIRHSYEQNGITPDPATHGNESPTMLDVIDTLAQIAENPSEFLEQDTDSYANKWKSTAEDLMMAFEPFREGNKFHNLAQPTDFDVGDNDVTYIDLSQVNAQGDSAGLMMQLLLSQTYQNAKDTKKKSMIVIDEASKIFRDDDNQAFLEEVFRHSRHFELSLNLLSQTIEEFFSSESAKAISDQCSIVQLHRIENVNRELGRDVLELNDRQLDYIDNAEPGNGDEPYTEALLDIRDIGKIPLQVEATQEEIATIDYKPNDPDDLLDSLTQQSARRIWHAIDQAYQSDEPIYASDWRNNQFVNQAKAHAAQHASTVVENADSDDPRYAPDTTPSETSTDTSDSDSERNECQATTKDGTPCELPAMDGSDYCHIRSHNNEPQGE